MFCDLIGRDQQWLIFWNRGPGGDITSLCRFDGDFNPGFGGGIFEEEFATGGVGNDDGDLRGFVEEETASRHFEIQIDLSEGAGRAGEERDASESPAEEGLEGFHGEGIESEKGCPYHRKMAGMGRAESRC